MPTFEFNSYRPIDTNESEAGFSISPMTGPDMVFVTFSLDLEFDGAEFTAEVQRYYRYTGNDNWELIPFDKQGGMNKLLDAMYDEVSVKDPWFLLVEPLIELHFTMPVKSPELSAFRSEYVHHEMNKLEDQLAELKKLASS